MRALAYLIFLPLAGWALLTVLDFRAADNVVVWLVAAVILHDLILLPAYSGLDRVARRAAGDAINYIRIPGGISLLMLLVFWSTIRGKGDGAYHYVSGVHYDGYGQRWLLVSAGLFAVSGALYLARRGGSRRRTARPSPSA
ncbi:hypothetical protein [Solirubrobacter soli]|uniref:hypothetical protein n=1 Tax=Solirubrobacter soli TaxID=363832 RepID=UPI0004148E1A|nr:hypothetical protein [Solirubrobacter soli]